MVSYMKIKEVPKSLGIVMLIGRDLIWTLCFCWRKRKLFLLPDYLLKFNVDNDVSPMNMCG